VLEHWNELGRPHPRGADCERFFVSSVRILDSLYADGGEGAANVRTRDGCGDATKFGLKFIVNPGYIGKSRSVINTFIERWVKRMRYPIGE